MKTKRFCVCIAFILTAFVLKAQIYNSSNSLTRVALVYYSLDGKGFFQKKENVSFQEVSNILRLYGYDKKSHELYIETDMMNCVVTVTNDVHKILKKNQNIPQLKGEELAVKVGEVNKMLEEKFIKLNHIREKQINDSIQKAYEDSVKKAFEDSIRLVKLATQKKNYRNAHDWQWVPISNIRLSCSLCDKTIVNQDSILCVGFRNDTLFNVSSEDLALDVSYLKIHPIKLIPYLKSDNRFKYHFEVFGDSLRAFSSKAYEDPEAFNTYTLYNAMQKVSAKAPYGYFEDWEWSSEYGNISFNFKYTNTNKNTIKYIEVFWVVTNDVGDVRKTGSFKGTGPLEVWDTGTWDWDHSMYYVAGDATKMNISKVVITYMNGSKITLPKGKLHFN